MTRRLLIALGLLLLPVAVRAVWFYRGVYSPASLIATPDYTTFAVPTPPLGATPGLTAESGGEGVVLVDLAHANNFRISELESFTARLTARGIRLETIASSSETPSLANRLKYAQALIVVAPMAPFTPDEVRLVRRFVDHGGRLLVMTDPTRSAIGVDYFAIPSPVLTVTVDVVAANSLLAPFDITFSDDYLYNLSENEGNFRNVFFTQFADGPVTAGLSRVAFYAAHSVATPSGRLLIVGGDHTYSSRTDSSGGLAAAALSADGRVLALGDLTFITAPYDGVADNAQLIANLAEFISSAKAERTHDLADFPFIFSQPVVLVPTEGITMTTDILNQAASLQTALLGAGIRLTPAKAPQADFDLIALGTYTATTSLETYISPFKIGLPDSPITGTLTIPGFGPVSPNGIGLILLSQKPERTTVVLVAQSTKSLANMIGQLASGNLSACVLTGGAEKGSAQTIAVCKAGEPTPIESASPTPPSTSSRSPP